MALQKLIKSQINRKFSFHFSTPTQDLFAPEIALKYFDPRASYTLIPGIQNSSIYDPQRLLTELMLHTENSILDICLPYIQTSKKKNAIRHLARYIVINKRLIGIRIKPSDVWPKLKTQKIPISTFLQKFYSQNAITNYPRQIVIGEFLIATKHFKLAPLFESELLSLTENNSRNILTDYYSLGCQIFTIVNDLNQQKRKNLKDHLLTLKNYRKQSTAVIYCGMHIAPELNDSYNTKSFAMQGTDNFKKIQINKFDQINAQTIIFDLNSTKKNRKIILLDDFNVFCSQIQTLDCSFYRVKMCFTPPQKNCSTFQIQEIQIQQTENVKKQNQLLLYLWYLYANINQRLPFTLPCPMTDKDQSFLKIILKLTKTTNIDPSALVNFLKLDSKGKLKKVWEKQNFKQILLDKAHRQIGSIYTYFSFKQRLSLLGIQKQTQLVAQIDKKIVNCSSCINEEIVKIIQNLNNQIKNMQISSEDQKFIEKFIKRKTGNSLDHFYFEAARYYPRNKLTSDFIWSLFEGLQSKSKAEFNGTSFQNFILKSKFQDIKHIFAEAQKRYFFAGNNLKVQEDQIQQQVPEQTQNTFRNFIKKVKLHCNNLKRHFFSCHICSLLFNRKQKANYGRFCLCCNNFVCFNCFDIKTGEYAQSQQNFQQCLVCQNKCDCDKCFRRKGKDLTINFQNYRNSLQIRQSTVKHPHEQINWNYSLQKVEDQKTSNFGIIIKSQFPRLIQKVQNKPIEEQFSSLINFCFQCQLHNRAQRNITFMCGMCQSTVCFTCQKAQNQKRNWTLRGKLFCNKCHQITCEGNQLKRTLIQKQSKLSAFQYELNQLKRQIIKGGLNMRHSTIQQVNQQIGQLNFEYQIQKGGATPIFDRSTQKQIAQSSLRFFDKRSPSQNGSIASFGGQKLKQNSQKLNKQKNNSSKSSRSKSPPTKRTNSPQVKKEIKKSQKYKRKNSSDSGHQSFASFNNKQDINRQERPNDSVRQKKLKNGAGQKRRDSSAQSGQYQGSQSSQKGRQQKKPNWANNKVHQNSQQNYKIGKGWNNEIKQTNNDQRGYHQQRGQNNRYKNKDQSNKDNYKGYSKQIGNNKSQRNQKGDNWGQGNRQYKNERNSNWKNNDQRRDDFTPQNNIPSRKNDHQNREGQKNNYSKQGSLLFTEPKQKSCTAQQEDIEY